MKSERELRNELAENHEIGTHVDTDKWFAKMLQGKHFKSGIDIGCNNGYGFSIYGKPFVEKATFVDFADKCLVEAKKIHGDSHQYVCADITQEWPIRGKYELVCLVQLVQHIPDEKVAEHVFAQACSLCTDTMIFSHYRAKKREVGKFSNGLFYRRLPYTDIDRMISENNMVYIAVEKTSGDYNFVLGKK